MILPKQYHLFIIHLSEFYTNSKKILYNTAICPIIIHYKITYNIIVGKLLILK